MLMSSGTTHANEQSPASASNANAPASPQGLIGGNFAISTAAAEQASVDVAYNDDDDEWLVVWRDARNGAHYGIYGQRVDRNGALKSGVLTIWDDADTLDRPAVAYDTTQHRFLVVWQNNANPAIEGRVVNANGTFYTSKIFITTGSLSRTFPDVAYNPITDEYLVVWAYGTTGANHDIYARKVGVDGIIDPGGTYVISADTDDEYSPAVMADPRDGRYLVVWSIHENGADHIVGRRLLSNGATSGATFTISYSWALGDQWVPALVFNSSNSQALVVWEDYRNPDADVYGRLVYSNNTIGNEFLVSDIAGSNANPSVTYDAADAQYGIVWCNSSTNIKGRWVSADTNTRGSAFTLSDSSSGAKWFPAVAFGAGRVLTVWTDYRNPTAADIYGQLTSVVT
jgi:hypothetical protein